MKRNIHRKTGYYAFCEFHLHPREKTIFQTDQKHILSRNPNRIWTSVVIFIFYELVGVGSPHLYLKTARNKFAETKQGLVCVENSNRRAQQNSESLLVLQATRISVPLACSYFELAQSSANSGTLQDLSQNHFCDESMLNIVIIMPWNISGRLACWTSDCWNLLARQESLLNPDYRTWLCQALQLYQANMRMPDKSSLCISPALLWSACTAGGSKPRRLYVSWHPSWI